MKTSWLVDGLRVAVLGGVLGLAVLAMGEDTDMLNKAFDLVHQAWNPGGDPPTDAQRTDLLNQALTLAENAPQHNVRRHRMQAIVDIKAALDMLKNGDPDHKATDTIHSAADELRDALSMSQ